MTMLSSNSTSINGSAGRALRKIEMAIADSAFVYWTENRAHFPQRQVIALFRVTPGRFKAAKHRVRARLA
jgi:hypothetical protein